MIRIKDEKHNRIYTFNINKVLIDIEQNHLSIWSRDSEKLPYIPTNVMEKLKSF